MRRLPNPDRVFRFLLCLSACLLCFYRQCRAEDITRFTRRYVMVNVDGEEIIETNDKGTVTNNGICPYVDVALAGEITGSADRMVAEECFLYGYGYGTGQYFRAYIGSKDATAVVPATGEEAVFSWHGLGKLNLPSMRIVQTVLIRERQMTAAFDGQAFQETFQIYYKKQLGYITSGMAMRASGYAAADSTESFRFYEDWFRARYNHNYEICYDYGFVQAAERGLSPEQGTLHENLSYFALPKQLTDPDGDARYQFLGWRVSGTGGVYTPGQGCDRASFRYGQPAESNAASVNLAALSLAEPEEAVSVSAAAAAAIAGETAGKAAESAAATATVSEIEKAAARSSLQGMSDGLRSTASSLRREASMDISSG